ncbi:putative motility protein [[Pseudomonas] carboxydohydrogena]|uniref:Motility protein n=1 Tax=Afipia carboxydohydrogena TaxID=290 RepID=A0ABY8BR94_AFICR|nr:putative motility protein [[Pseudomonas] carboxydohydrogena]WEF52204.1 putative motility protein [[Pseudomonas] carboxydohydrogena]
MDMSLVAAAMAMQAGNTQQQIATSVLKSQLNAQGSVLQLLAPAQNAPAANNAAGIGGQLDIFA